MRMNRPESSGVSASGTWTNRIDLTRPSPKHIDFGEGVETRHVPDLWSPGKVSDAGQAFLDELELTGPEALGGEVIEKGDGLYRVGTPMRGEDASWSAELTPVNGGAPIDGPVKLEPSEVFRPSAQRTPPDVTMHREDALLADDA